MARADFTVRGSRELGTLARRLKEAGDGKLRSELLRSIRAAAKPAIPDIEASALANLPRRGGLAARVAAQAFAVRTSLTGTGGRVSLVGRGMKELRDIDSGRLRHPLFGNRDVWIQQDVKPGFFTDPIEAKAPDIRTGIERAINRVAGEIGRGL